MLSSLEGAKTSSIEYHLDQICIFFFAKHTRRLFLFCIESRLRTRPHPLRNQVKEPMTTTNKYYLYYHETAGTSRTNSRTITRTSTVQLLLRHMRRILLPPRTFVYTGHLWLVKCSGICDSTSADIWSSSAKKGRIFVCPEKDAGIFVVQRNGT